MYNISAQQLASSGNQRIFNFRVMAVRDIKLLTCLWKNIYAYSEVKVLGKVLVLVLVFSVQKISRLDSQSKFTL